MDTLRKRAFEEAREAIEKNHALPIPTIRSNASVESNQKQQTTFNLSKGLVVVAPRNSDSEMSKPNESSGNIVGNVELPRSLSEIYEISNANRRNRNKDKKRSRAVAEEGSIGTSLAVTDNGSLYGESVILGEDRNSADDAVSF